MGNILGGVVLICIGLFNGDSIFRGQFSVVSVFFDGVGLLLIGKGIYGLTRRGSE